MQDLAVAALLGALASLAAAVAIIGTQHLHGRITDDSAGGVQKVHARPTPRVGGIALLVGALVGGLVKSGPTDGLWVLLCLSALPAFSFGLLEDITKRVSPRMRLWATIAAGAGFVFLTGHGIESIGFGVVDRALVFWPVSLVVTAIAIGGMANAFNIIDGFNGLASGTVLIILAGIKVLSAHVGDVELQVASTLAFATVFGFFLINFPFGRLFLGDSGAYASGFMVAALTVALVSRNPEVSPMVAPLLLGYPLIETFVSIRRRMMRRNGHPYLADRMHLHSLVFWRRARPLARELGRLEFANSLTSVFLLGIPMLSVGLSLVSFEGYMLSAANLGFLIIFYLVVYRRIALLPPFVFGPRKELPAISMADLH